MKSPFKRLLSLCLCLVLVVVVLPVSPAEAVKVESIPGFEYYIYDGSVIIYGRADDLSGHIIIPDTIDGLPVTRVGANAFVYSEATQITIPASVNYINSGAFEDAFYLRNIVFLGDAPYIDPHAFGEETRYGYEGLDPEPFRGTVSYPAHSSGWDSVSHATYDYEGVTWVAIHNRAEGDEGTLITAPTCTTDGKIRYTCTVCNKTVTETATALGHSYEAVIVSPTCTEDGSLTNICTTCGKVKGETEAIPALGHSWDSGTSITAATCTTDGIASYVCGTCGEIQIKTTSALGHSWDNGTVTTQPTCTEAGVRCYTCKTCSETKEQTISATGHSWGEPIVVGTPNCMEAVTVDHICTQCGTVGNRQTLPAPGHSYESTIEAATCTQPGRIVYTCKTCGDVRSTETSPATGHSEVTDPAIAATCTASGLTEGKHCSTCNEVLVAQESIPATDHSYKTAVVNPTCTENGSITSTCTSCGDTVTGIIPATGHAFENGSCIHCGEPEAVSLPGDVNSDGKVNIMDVAKLYAHIKGTLLIEDETQLRQADLTGDGNVNILDIAKLYASVKGTE